MICFAYVSPNCQCIQFNFAHMETVYFGKMACSPTRRGPKALLSTQLKNSAVRPVFFRKNLKLYLGILVKIRVYFVTCSNPILVLIFLPKRLFRYKFAKISSVVQLQTLQCKATDVQIQPKFSKNLFFELVITKLIFLPKTQNRFDNTSYETLIRNKLVFKVTVFIFHSIKSILENKHFIPGHVQKNKL